MKKTEIQTLLDENIPESVIKHRDQGGKTLSYLEAWYVIDRMNQIFGQGNWGYTIQTLNKVHDGEVEQYNGKAFSTNYIACITAYADVDGKRVQFTDVGYGDGTDKKNPGKAHELASKEAVSDGMKRACKNFGRSLGLALYDKTQEFVGKPNTEASQPTPDNTTVAPKSHQEPTPRAVNSVANNKDRPIKELVSSVFKALEAQGKITAVDFKKKYLGGKGLSTLTPKQLEPIYEAVSKDFNLGGN